MKQIYTIFLFFLLFGCADKTAFEIFDVSKEKEIALNEIEIEKITNDKNKLEGSFSVVYLNNIYPEKFKNETFFITLYLKKTDIYDYNITLNDKPYTNIVKLPKDNNYTKLTDIDFKWNSYYLVEFNATKEKKMVLKLEKNSYKINPLNFVKISKN